MPRYVLMLENDHDDRYFTQSTVAELRLNIAIRYEYYSPTLLELLPKDDLPALILLGYNTSPDNVVEMITLFRTNNLYAAVPLIILTEELQNSDIRKYYLAGANTVIKKPASVELTQKKVKTFFSYWFEVAEL